MPRPIDITRVRRLFICAAAAASLLGGCGGGSDNTPSPSPPPTVAVASVVVTPSRLSLQPGQSVVLSAVARDAAGAPVTNGVTLAWQSSDPAVVAVQGNTARALGNGQAELTAVANGTRSDPLAVRVADAIASDTLIKAARAAGTIDATTALKYRVFALYKDERLPLAFLGNTESRYDNETGFDLALAFNSLSELDQAELAPFMLPPIYKDSWLGKRRHVGGAVAVAGGESPAVQMAALSSRRRPIAADQARPLESRPVTCSGVIDEGWVSVDSVNFKVWYDASAPLATAVSAADATSVSTAAEDAHAAMRALGMRPPQSDASALSLCHGGDGRIDIYLVAPGTFGTAGNLGVSYTIDEQVATSSAFINVNAGAIGTSALYGTVVHEFMHVVQAAYQNHLKTGAGAGVFLKDATADWAIDYVRATDQGEQPSARSLLRTLEFPLWSTVDGDRRYGAYLFFQFVARVRDADGNDYGGAAAVRNLWEQIAAQPSAGFDALAALNQALPRGLSSTWNAFSVAALNVPPMDRFLSIDNLVEGAPFGRTTAVVNGTTTEIWPTPRASDGSDYRVSELAARHERFTFSAFDNSVSSLTFFNGYTFGLLPEDLPLRSEFFNPPITLTAGSTLGAFAPTAQERSQRALTALIKINGQWTVEDWTDVPVRFFCRERNAERVEEIVLVFSNGAYTDIRAPADDARGDLGPLATEPTGLSSRFVSSKMPCHQFQGSANGSTTVTSGGNNFTITNSYSALFRGRPSLATVRLRGRDVTLLPGVTFETSTGTLNSRLTGVLAGCRNAPFNETAAPQRLPDQVQSPSFRLLTNYLPDAAAHGGYMGAGGRTFFGLDPSVCTGGRSVDTPAPAAFDFDALWQAPVVNSIFKIDLAGRRLQQTNVEGPTAFTGSFPAPVTSKSTWCFVATREGETAPSGSCP